MITHRVPIEEAPQAYVKFRDKKDGCIKVVIKPGMAGLDPEWLTNTESEPIPPAVLATP